MHLRVDLCLYLVCVISLIISLPVVYYPRPLLPITLFKIHFLSTFFKLSDHFLTTFDRWSSDGERVACGSSDRVVRIWDAASAKLLYALPGHKGSVNEVIFNPVRPDVVASCGSDKQIFIGELTSS